MSVQNYNIINFLDKIGDLESASIDNLKEAIHPYFLEQGLFKAYLLPLPRKTEKIRLSDSFEDIHKKRKNSTSQFDVLYRGRNLKQLPSKDKITLSDLKHPDPSKHKIPINRANREGRAAFYCSDMEIGAYQELGLKEGEEAVIGYWRITEQFSVFNVGVTYFSRQYKFEPADTVTAKHKSILDSDEFRLFENFLGHVFSAEVDKDKNAYLYKLSIAVAEKLLDGPFIKQPSPLIGGIIYPSTKFAPRKVDNLVITPNCVSQCLEWYRAEHIRINKIHADGIDIERLDFSQQLDGQEKLIWKGLMDKKDAQMRSSDGQIKQRKKVVMGDNFFMELDKQ